MIAACRLAMLSLLILSKSMTTLARAQIELQPTQELAVPNQPGSHVIMSPVKCDTAGALYMQLPDPKHFLAGPLLKISSDGKDVVRYSLDSVPDIKEVAVMDFAVGSTGEVYFLVSSNGNAYVLRFDRDGTYDSTIRLRQDFAPSRIGIFGTGDLFISGMKTRSAASSQRAPASALVSSQGEVLKYIMLRRDLKSSARQKQKWSSQLSDRDFEQAVTGSFIESVDDGNVYVARRTPKGPIFVVSPSGALVRTISLKPPTNAELSDIRVSHGRIAAMFVRKGGSGGIERVIFSVIDASTGRAIAEYYHSSASLGAALACYVPNTFTFLASDESLRIIRAEPQ